MSEERFLQKLAALGESEAAREIAGDYRRMHQRMAKLARISDGYQEQLRDLNHKLQETNHDLSRALAEVKTLQGLIPICARCKRIRDDDGMWDQIESYITQHSGAVFSHGVCPECAKALFPEVAKGPKEAPRPAADPQPSGLGPEEQAIRRAPRSLPGGSGPEGTPADA